MTELGATPVHNVQTIIYLNLDNYLQHRSSSYCVVHDMLHSRGPPHFPSRLRRRHLTLILMDAGCLSRLLQTK